MGPTRLLLIVEDTFAIAGRGLLIAPVVDLGGSAQRHVVVELRRPDGTRFEAEALAQVPFVNPPRAVERPRHVLLFTTLAKQDVPIGTELWIAYEPPPKEASKVRASIEQLAHHVPGPDADLTATSGCIEELFRELGHEDIGEPIAEAVERGILTQDQGRWFVGVAVWSGQTNGADLRPTLERWLEEARDSLRIGLALDQDIFPFRSLGEMTRVLTPIMTRHPQHAERCRQLIENRGKQEG